MNENAKKWVEALRSGEYEQGRRYLRDGDQFCCLGVGCDLYSRAVDAKWDWNGGDASFMGENEVLPGDVKKWLGLTGDEGDFTPVGGSVESLMYMNDDGASFAEIADIIESEPPGLFVDQKGES